MTNVIKIDNLHKVYNSTEVRVHALRGVSLAIDKGDFVPIMGSLGYGKPTPKHGTAFVDRPTRGQYFLDGVEVSRFSKDQRADIRNRQIGFVFQGYNLLRRTTATENVELPLIYANVPAAERTRRSIEALRIVGLADKTDSQPNQLSGGQQQRVAIARALVNQPALLLADEPTGNLDSRTAIDVMSVFQHLNDTGMTIVVVTHEPDIAQYAKRIVVMRDGQIILDQPVRKRRSADAELAAAPQTSQLEEAFQ